MSSGIALEIAPSGICGLGLSTFHFSNLSIFTSDG